MKILVTGSSGFIGKNLVTQLKSMQYSTIFECHFDTPHEVLEKFCKEADFVFHLAGVNRPKNDSEFFEGNYKFTLEILSLLKKHGNLCPILMTSSIQAELKNPYGESKLASEKLLFEYSKEYKTKVLIYRLPNVFGKWSNPNYNSVIATFCHNISRDLPITINDENYVMKLVYIDDVVNEFIQALLSNENRNGDFCEIPYMYKYSLKKITELLYSFKNSRENLIIPDTFDDFTKKLYSTYLSYLPSDSFLYDLNMKNDYRGSFTEFIKTKFNGQVSINISKPGIVKGNHWHNTKNEKFLVVSGTGVIRLRKIDSNDIIEYFVNGEKLQVVDIPVGYTHNIENIGKTDMITIMWANELFDIEKPDTYYLEV